MARSSANRKTSATGGSEPPPALGIGQLTLVEHALCPLNSRVSLVENLVHNAIFRFTDARKHRRHGRARIICPAGLSAADEFYLWGLLALTLAESEPDGEFCATPHYCLRRLGVIDQFARRGGRQYSQFTQAIERLSLVRYRNDKFYDPLRGEHRRVSFGFFSYSLPLDPKSSRAWRFAWDPIFFPMVQATGGHLRFDLSVYRTLDPASRRMLLLVSKLFHRRATASLDLQLLAVEVLGFSPTMAIRNLKAKVGTCARRLSEAGVLADWHWERTRRGNHMLVLNRAATFGRPDGRAASPQANSGSVADPLRTIGLDERTIGRLLRRYPKRLLQEWADITLAAIERHGMPFFTRSPQAYFIDNVRNAAVGRRTPPDWWHQLRRSEQQAKRQADRVERQTAPRSTAEILQAVAGDRTASISDAVRALFQRQT